MADKDIFKRKPPHETIVGKIANELMKRKLGIIDDTPKKSREQINKEYAPIEDRFREDK